MTTVSPSILPQDLDRPTGPKPGDRDESTRSSGIFEKHVEAADAQFQQSSDTTTGPAVENSPEHTPAPGHSEAPLQEVAERPAADLTDLLTGAATPRTPQDNPLSGSAPLHSHGPEAREELPPGLAKLAERGLTGNHPLTAPEQASTDGQAIVSLEPVQQNTPTAAPSQPEAIVAPIPEHAALPDADDAAALGETEQSSEQTLQHTIAPQPSGSENEKSAPVVERPDPTSAVATESKADESSDPDRDVPLETTAKVAGAEALPEQTPTSGEALQSPVPGPAQPQSPTEPVGTTTVPPEPSLDAELGEPAVRQEQRPAEPASDPVRAARSQVPPAAPTQPARQNATVTNAAPDDGTDTPVTAASDAEAVEFNRLKGVSERPSETTRRTEPGLLARLSTLELAGENPRANLTQNAAMSAQTTAAAQADNGKQLGNTAERVIANSATPNASPAMARPVAEAVPTGTPATPAVVIEQGTPVPLQPVSTSASTFALSPAPTTAAGLQVPVAALAVHISRAFDQGNTRFQVRMDPPELGRVDIKLDMSVEGRVQAHLTVERPETLDLMMRDARSLEKALADTGLNLSKESLSFSLKDQNSANPQADTASEDATAEAAEDETTAGTTDDTGIRGYITDSGVDISV